MQFDAAGESMSEGILELSDPVAEPADEMMVEAAEASAAIAMSPMAEATVLELGGLDMDAGSLESSPLEMALDEAEFSTDDGEELEGVFVELIEE